MPICVSTKSLQQAQLTTQMLALRDGDHLCLFYERHPAEQMPALAAFIAQALESGEQFIYVADDQTSDELMSRLEETGVAVEQELASGRLKLWTRQDWREAGALDAVNKARQLRGLIDQAFSEGFKGVRFAFEMTWTLGPDIGVRQLERWEAMLSTIFVPGFPGRMVCLYNRSRLAADVLVSALHTHPLAVLGEHVCTNPFYQAPLILRGGEGQNGKYGGSVDAGRFDWMVSQLLRERTRAENASLRVAAIVESSEDAIVSKDLDGTVTSWNKGAERLFGYTAEEIVGRSILTIIPEDRRHEEPGIVARMRQGERIEHVETVRRCKDGRLVTVSMSISPIRDHNGAVVGASKIARDVTSRRRAEQQQQALYELAGSVNRAEALPEIYNAALDAICRCQQADRAAILLCDEDGVMRFKISRGLSETYRRAVEGHSPWTSAGRSPQPVWIGNVATSSLVPPLHQAVVEEGIRALAFIPLTYEKRLIGKFMLYYDAPHEFSAEELRPVEAIASQVAFAIERQKSSAALEALVAERTASLRHAIAQMEEFSYSMSHDLRAPLRAMQGYASVLMEDYGDRLDDEGREFLQRIVRNSTRMDHLIRDTLTYTRINSAEIQLQPVALDRLVREIVQQYPEMQPPRACIVLPEPLPAVTAHEPSLSQAVSNLLNNAVKFVDAGVTPEVTIRAQVEDNQVRLLIDDNGIGIRPEHQHRIFGMFERIHPAKKYEGTGIGLAIVRRAVERMGGKVGFESDGIRGCRFWIQLPPAPQS